MMNVEYFKFGFIQVLISHRDSDGSVAGWVQDETQSSVKTETLLKQLKIFI